MNKLSKSNIKRVRMLLRSYKARFGAFINPCTGIVFFDPKDHHDRNDNRAWARAIHACRYFFNEESDEYCDNLLRTTNENYYEHRRELPIRSGARSRWYCATLAYREKRDEIFNTK